MVLELTYSNFVALSSKIKVLCFVDLQTWLRSQCQGHKIDFLSRNCTKERSQAKTNLIFVISSLRRFRNHVVLHYSCFFGNFDILAIFWLGKIYKKRIFELSETISIQIQQSTTYLMLFFNLFKIKKNWSEKLACWPFQEPKISFKSLNFRNPKTSWSC